MICWPFCRTGDSSLLSRLGEDQSGGPTKPNQTVAPLVGAVAKLCMVVQTRPRINGTVEYLSLRRGTTIGRAIGPESVDSGPIHRQNPNPLDFAQGNPVDPVNASKRLLQAFRASRDEGLHDELHRRWLSYWSLVNCLLNTDGYFPEIPEE